MKTEVLKTLSGECQIVIPRGMTELKDHMDPSSSIILADSNVLRIYSSELSSFRVIDAGTGEKAKDIEHAASVIGRLIELGIDRNTLIVGVGGGIITDLTGFIASVFLRGVRFGFVSTSLLGQVDAAIGGKNGVNYQGYKNMIGTIRQPDFVFCDIASLSTLPSRDFTGGFSEIIKYGAIKRPDLFDYLEDNILPALQKERNVLEYLIFESVMTKKVIVERDEREMGERKLLNFGHTFAHAIEKIYQKSHGEAVAIGMVMAAKLSVNLGLMPSSIEVRLRALIENAGLPTEMETDPKAMAEVMRRDKKRAGDKMSFVLLESIGKAITFDIPISEIETVLEEIVYD